MSQEKIRKVLPIFHELLQFNYGAKLRPDLLGDFKRVSVSLRLDSVNQQSPAADAVKMFCHVRSYLSSMSDYAISDHRQDDQYWNGRYGVYFVIYYR